MRSGWLRLVLARVAAYRAVLVVAWLVILATVTLFAASAIYAEAVGRSGLAARLARSAVREGNVQVRVVSPTADVATADSLVTAELLAALGEERVNIHRVLRADSFALPERPDDARELALPAFADGLADHARLLDGKWPVGGQQRIQTVLSAAAAERLGLAVGDRLTVASVRDAARQLDVQVVGVFEPIDAGAPFWWQDGLELDGVSAAGSFTTFGPLYLDRADLLERAAGTSLTLIWRAEPNVAAIDAASIGHIEAALRRLPASLDEHFGNATVNVDTALPQVLSSAASSLLVSRAGILLLDLQLGLLGLYALVMLSALIIEQRRADNALLRSRGTSFGQLTRLGVAEGVLLIVPAIVVAPPLALVLVGAFDSVGPLADIGVVIAPRLGGDAIALAVGAGVVALLGLSLPALAASGPIASVRRMIGRQLHRTAAQRLGLDIALLVLAGVALWQLNQYGTPLTRSLRGSLGVDPLLVAAPMVGLLAGALVSLRLFPVLARSAERLLAGRRGPALAIRQLARRPLNYTRAAMLLIVAAAVTVFAGAYGATAVASQHDQVAYDVGSDARVETNERLEPVQLSAAFAELDAVSAVAPVVRGGYQLGSRTTRGSVLALGLPEQSKPVALRPDLAPAPLDALFARLAPGAGMAGVALPPGAHRLAIDVVTELTPVDADAVNDDWQALAGSAVLIDGGGLMYRIEADGTLGREGGRLVFMLPDHAGLAGQPLRLTLAALEVVVRAPPGSAVHGTLAVGGVSSSGSRVAEDWQPLASDLGRWSGARLGERALPAPLEPAEAIPGGVAILPGLPLRRAGRQGYSLRAPGVEGTTGQPLPALVNRAFLEEGGLEVGGVATIAEPFSTARTITPVEVVGGFPTLSAEVPLAVVDLSALALADYADLGRLPAPTEFWLAAADADPATLRRQLAASALAPDQVIIAADALTERLTDPLSVGTTGALLIGTVAALLFAVIGFLTNAAVGVRERMIEFGLLRSLGVSRGQLAHALALESSFLLAASLIVGALLGVALALLALPTATITEQGLAPVPPAVPVWPLEPLLVLAAVAVGTLLAALVLFRRLLAAEELASLLRLREE